jgi:hypothetical protein
MASDSSLISRIAKKSNKWLFLNSDAVVFIGDNMAKHAMNRYGTPSKWRIIELVQIQGSLKELK